MFTVGSSVDVEARTGTVPEVTARNRTTQRLALGILGTIGVRHRVVLGALLLLWLSGVAYHLFSGNVPAEYATTYLLLILLQMTLSVSPRVGEQTQQFYAAGALLTATAVLVEAAGHQLYAHMGFIAALSLLTLYQNWVTYLGGVAYLALYYLVFGVANADSLYAEGPRNAAWWPVTFFITAVVVSLIGVVGWILHQRTAHETEALRVRLAEAGLRERQARELNDTVVQHLVTTLYAAEEGTPQEAADAARAALTEARLLVSSLLTADWVYDKAALVRDTPSQSVHSEDPA